MNHFYRFSAVMRFTCKLFPIMICIGLFFASDSCLQEKPVVRIGVLANRGVEQCRIMWTPTADYLSQRIPDVSFQIVPLLFGEIHHAVRNRDIDFILANPSIYVSLEMNQGVSRIVTLKTMSPEGPCMNYGGVIIFKSERSDLKQLSDLKDKSFIGANTDSFGWVAIRRELKEKGIDPFTDLKLMSFAETHDDVISAVQNGKADAGGLRTGVLEALSRQGKIRLEDFGVIHEHGNDEPELPFIHSTRGYPEWPLAKLPHIPNELGENAAIALMQMPHDSEPALAAGGAGWTIPGNYQSVHHCLKLLNLEPYENFGKISLPNIIKKYIILILVIGFGMTGIIIFAVATFRLNRELKTSLNRESRLAAIVNTTEDGIIGVRTDGVIETCNPAGFKLFGYSPETMLNAHISMLMAPETGQADGDMLDAVCRGCRPFGRHETEMVSADNKQISVSLTLSPIKNTSGAIIGASIIARNITQRKQSEKLLLKTHRALTVLSFSNRALIYADNEKDLPDTICKIIVETGRYRMARVGFAEKAADKTVRNVSYAGYEEGYLDEIGLSLKDPGKGYGPTGIVLQTGKPCVIRNISADPDFEPWREAALKRGYASLIALPLCDNKGTFGVLSIYAEEPDAFDAGEYQLLEDLANNLAFGLKAIRTESERKKAEEGLRRLDAAIEQSDESVIITDSSGTILYVNPSFERISGYSKQEAVGQNPRILKSDKQNPDFYRNLWDAVTSGKVWRGRFSNKRKDGSIYEAEASVSPVFDNSGNIMNYVSVSRDITREMLMEAQLRQAQKMEAIGTLAGGIAHDFNNILFPIFGYAQMTIEQVSENSIAKKNLEKLLTAAQRAKDLVQQILAFSRKDEQTFHPLKIQFILKECLKLLKSVLPKTISIREDIDTSCKPVIGDATQIHQIIINICTNAYHAMRQKGGVLSVSLKETELSIEDSEIKPGLSPGLYVRLNIGDTGHGIDPAIRDIIFNPFFTTKPPGEGTGMGLSVTHGIIKSHNGFISVYSELGVGSTFSVYLPCADAVVKSPESEPAPVLAKGNAAILIVDDEETIVAMLHDILEKKGYHITGCTSSPEALSKFEQNPRSFDLVITDQTMPEITGIQLVKRMISIRPDIPIILCTGFSDIVTEEQAKAAGVREFVMKPVITGDIARAINNALGERDVIN